MLKLNSKRVAILMTDGFEEVEFTEPRQALESAGAVVDVVAPRDSKVKAWASTDWGIEYDVDKNLEDANASHYDALMLPGGVMNPDEMRQNPKAIAFAESFIDDQKPIAAICHAAQLLIETGKLKGRKLTSYPALKTDLINAGAKWVDEEVVIDGKLITSRSPDDLDAFNINMVREFAKG